MDEQDKYEYRIGYQYLDGEVGHTAPIDEHETAERLQFWDTHNRFLLLTHPWLERRRILKWTPCPPP